MDSVNDANRALKAMEEEAASSLKNHGNHSGEEKTESNIVQLILFWSFVLIPLIWGVIQTFDEAMKLFE